MKKLWISFWALCLVIALGLGWRLWNLRLLYLDADIRSQVKATMEETAESKGWLLSDIELLAVYSDYIEIVHHQHVRGKDPRTPYSLPFAP